MAPHKYIQYKTYNRWQDYERLRIGFDRHSVRIILNLENCMLPTRFSDRFPLLKIAEYNIHTCKVLVPIGGQCLFSDSWGKDSEVWKKTLLSQIQLIPSIAALISSLAIDFYPDLFRISRGKNSRFVFNEENGAFFTLENSFRAEKNRKNNSKLERKTFDLRWSENQSPCCVSQVFWAYVLTVNRCKVELL